MAAAGRARTAKVKNTFTAPHIGPRMKQASQQPATAKRHLSVSPYGSPIFFLHVPVVGHRMKESVDGVRMRFDADGGVLETSTLA